jgi:dodecin
VDAFELRLIFGQARNENGEPDSVSQRVAIAANREERDMSDSVYRVTEVIGVSADSWEAAAQNAVQTAARTIRDLRVAEATRFDVTIEDGKIASYRVRLDLSFKFESGD